MLQYIKGVVWADSSGMLIPHNYAIEEIAYFYQEVEGDIW